MLEGSLPRVRRTAHLLVHPSLSRDLTRRGLPRARDRRRCSASRSARGHRVRGQPGPGAVAARDLDSAARATATCAPSSTQRDEFERGGLSRRSCAACCPEWRVGMVAMGRLPGGYISSLGMRSTRPVPGSSRLGDRGPAPPGPHRGGAGGTQPERASTATTTSSAARPPGRPALPRAASWCRVCAGALLDLPGRVPRARRDRLRPRPRRPEGRREVRPGAFEAGLVEGMSDTEAGRRASRRSETDPSQVPFMKPRHHERR